MNPINVFLPKFRTDEILEEIKECLEKGWTGMGYKTDEFEKRWNNYSGLDNSIFLSSNTAGLHLALSVLSKIEGWEAGSEIITTPLTFVSTNHTILYQNLKPVFADVDEYLCLDPASVKKNIGKKTRAVVFVGMGGNPGKLDEIKEICQENNLRLILDAAHMAGTYVKTKNGQTSSKGIHVGGEVDVAVFSFQAVKNLPTADSGMICFRDNNHYELARKLSWLGISHDTFQRTSSTGSYRWKYDVPEIGYKYNGNSIMAAIGIVQLKYLDEDNAKRNKLAKIYNNLIKEIPNIRTIAESDYCVRSSKHLYQIVLEDPVLQREELFKDFYDKSIFPGVHYRDNTEYPMYKFARGQCPYSHNVSENIISLPLHLSLEVDDLHSVVKVIDNFVKKN